MHCRYFLLLRYFKNVRVQRCMHLACVALDLVSMWNDRSHFDVSLPRCLIITKKRGYNFSLMFF